MRFAGRGFLQPVVSRSVAGGEVRFRVDCERNAEAWAELTLTRGDLITALAELDAADDRDQLTDDDLTPLASELEGTPGAILPAEGS